MPISGSDICIFTSGEYQICLWKLRISKHFHAKCILFSKPKTDLKTTMIHFYFMLRHKIKLSAKFFSAKSVVISNFTWNNCLLLLQKKWCEFPDKSKVSFRIVNRICSKSVIWYCSKTEMSSTEDCIFPLQNAKWFPKMYLKSSVSDFEIYWLEFKSMT